MIEKAAEGVGLDERIRMHGLAHALVAFGQGIAFFHAGCDILRSKSLDRDSYNSGMAKWLQMHSVFPETGQYPSVPAREAKWHHPDCQTIVCWKIRNLSPVRRNVVRRNVVLDSQE